MKEILTRLAASVALSALIGLVATGAALAAGELHIYNWGDYTNPDLIKKFEETHQVKVTLDDYSSNEDMLAKVQAGNSGYDIVVPGDYMINIMIGKDLLEKVEPNQMPNFKNLDPQWVDVWWDKGRHYSIPWQWGVTAFSVDTAVYNGPDVNSLKMMFEPPKELQGRINMLDDMNDVINAGLRYLGLPRCNANPEDLKKLNALLQNAKPHWRTMSYDTINLTVSKDVDLSQVWNGAAMRARLQRPTMRFIFPKEGATLWMDNVAILKGAPNLENAKLFMDFIMDPENAALISAHAKYNNGVAGSEKFLPAEMQDAPEITGVKEAPNLEFVPTCPENVARLYDKIWTNLKR
jgi:spermidine/putrescine transport system substrate-binding protein